MSATIIRTSVIVLVLALLVGCSKKEEKAPATSGSQTTPAAAQTQPAQAASLIDETKRNAEAFRNEAAPPFSQLPGALDQLANHMEARAQARQQGTDTAQADAQIAGDVTQLQQFQNSMSTFQPEGEKKLALDRLNESLSKVIEIVRQGQELKATLKSGTGSDGAQLEATASQDAAQGGFTQDSGANAAPAQEPGATAGQTAASTETVGGESTQVAASKAGTPAALSPPDTCCTIAPNPDMKGRLGRLVVTYPAGSKADARTGILKGTKEVASGYGNKAFDLLPGNYSVVISGKRVDNVAIQSGHDTKVKVGVLRVTASGNTRIGVLDADGKTEISSGYGKKQFGLPIGAVYVMISGQKESVTIKDGEITDF